MTSPAALPEEPHPSAQTLRWEFPYREPARRRGVFEVRRVAPDALGEDRSTEITFRVDLEPASAAGAPGVLRARLSWATSEPEEEGARRGEGPGLDLPTDEMMLVAAEAWTQCYLGTDERSRGWLGQVLGSEPALDGQIAKRFLSTRAPLFADELAHLSLEVEVARDELAGHEEARTQLTSALLRAFAELHALLLPSEEAFDPLAVEEGMPRWDARLARYLEQLNQPKLAGELRERGRQMARLPGTFWSRWVPGQQTTGDRGKPPLRWGPLYRLSYAALALWRAKVRPTLERRQRNPAGLAFPIYEGVTRLHSRTFRQEDRDGQRIILFPGDEVARIERVEPLKLPTFEMAVLDNILKRGFELLGSITAHRVLRWEVSEGHRRALRGEPDARALHVDGGWSGLASALGLASKKAADELHAIVAAQAHCAFLLPGGSYGNLLSYTIVPARGRRSGAITIILGDALLPHYIFELRKHLGDASRSAREAQRLVPMVDLPPLVGRPNEHGQQATFSLAVVAEMRTRARELALHGGVQIDAGRFVDLAERAGLPLPLLDAVLNRWMCDDADSPAFLVRVEPNRYVLGPHHASARNFLLEAGQREIEGSEAGQRSVSGRKQAAKRRREKGSPRRS